MKLDKKHMLLYAVTDRAWSGTQSLYEQVEAALKGGVTCVQLREKSLEYEKFLEEGKALSRLCRRYEVPFIVNDNVEIALKCKADGVHLGQEDGNVSQVRSLVGEKMIIGVSAHSVKEAKEAVAAGADYLGVGSVFATSTKSDVHRITYETLQEICKSVTVPVVAIGGIDEGNLLELSGSGVDGVALVSAIFSAQDIEQECQKLRALSEKMTGR